MRRMVVQNLLTEETHRPDTHLAVISTLAVCGGLCRGGVGWVGCVCGVCVCVWGGGLLAVEGGRWGGTGSGLRRMQAAPAAPWLAPPPTSLVPPRRPPAPPTLSRLSPQVNDAAARRLLCGQLQFKMHVQHKGGAGGGKKARPSKKGTDSSEAGAPAAAPPGVASGRAALPMQRSVPRQTQQAQRAEDPIDLCDDDDDGDDESCQRAALIKEALRQLNTALRTHHALTRVPLNTSVQSRVRWHWRWQGGRWRHAWGRRMAAPAALDACTPMHDFAQHTLCCLRHPAQHRRALSPPPPPPPPLPPLFPSIFRHQIAAKGPRTLAQFMDLDLPGLSANMKHQWGPQIMAAVQQVRAARAPAALADLA